MALYLKPSVRLCAAISAFLMPAYGLDLDRGSGVLSERKFFHCVATGYHTVDVKLKFVPF
jgi:hypothetical protein